MLLLLKAAGKRLVTIRGFDENKIINIPNTIDLKQFKITQDTYLKEEFSLGNDKIIIGSVGLLTERKGHYYLIEAANILYNKKKINKFVIIIFGEGEERNNLEILIKKYGLDNICLLPGFKNNIQNYIKDIDVFVLPSISNEDFPYVNLEAMLLSKPIIGTDVAGIPEQVINEYNGYLIEPRNIEDLVNSLEKMILNNEKNREMGNNSYELFKNKYNYELIINKYIKLFESL